MRFYVFLLVFFMLACKEGKKYHDELGAEQVELRRKTTFDKTIQEHRKELNKEFRDPSTSPLKEKDRKRFMELDFFPPDEAFKIKAKFERTPNDLPFLMPTTTGDTNREVRYGIVYFSFGEKSFSLNVYQNQVLKFNEGYEDHLFLPFSDDTNGNETYGGGRYLNLTIPKTDSITIDFNKAYNPYCVYNEKYSCPIVPAENHIAYEVKAGERDFKP